MGFGYPVVIIGVLALIPAIVASEKGREALVFWLYGLILFPIALVHSIVMPDRAAEQDHSALQPGERRRCPFCAESIQLSTPTTTVSA